MVSSPAHADREDVSNRATARLSFKQFTESASTTPEISPPPSKAGSPVLNSRLSATFSGDLRLMQDEVARNRTGTAVVISAASGADDLRFLDLTSTRGSDWAAEMEEVRAVMGWTSIFNAGSFLPPPSPEVTCHYHVYTSNMKDKTNSLQRNEVTSNLLGKPSWGDAVIVRSGPSGTFEHDISQDDVRAALVWHGAAGGLRQTLSQPASFFSLVKRSRFMKMYPASTNPKQRAVVSS